MSKFFDPTSRQNRLLGLVYLIFGILLCFFSRSILLTCTRIMGVCLVLYGIWCLYDYFIRRKSTAPGTFFVGLPCVVFGLVFAFSPESLLSIFPVLGGVMLIVNSIIQMQKAFTLKDYGFENWGIALVLAIVLMVAGVIVLLRPIQTLSFILKLVGVCLMVEAVMVWYTQYEVDKFMPRPRQ